MKIEELNTSFFITITIITILPYLLASFSVKLATMYETSEKVLKKYIYWINLYNVNLRSRP